MRPLMWGGLALAVALTAWAAFQDDEGAVEAVRSDKAARAKSTNANPQAGPARAASAATRRASKDGSADEDTQAFVLGIKQWQDRAALASSLPSDAAGPWDSQRPPPPPPPPVVAEAPPPPPMAPAFPHAWAGRFNDRAIVAGPNTTWVVGPGDMIDGQWRVDQIQDRQMTLTYLPLKQSQTVAMKAP